LPKGFGYSLPKNSDVVIQVHYHRNGRLERDKTQIGLYFAKDKVKPYQGGIIMGHNQGTKDAARIFPNFVIPQGAERFPLEGDVWATGDFTLHSVMPHMHMIGRDIKVTITPPDGEAATLIHIDNWDYNWQETYFLKQPIPIQKGTRFHVGALYDNSAKNPNNPF